MSCPGYLPIGDYGLIGDLHTAALVSGDGSLDWLCAPRFDSPSVFARILDSEHGGYFALRPAEPCASRARYLGATALLQTTFQTATGDATLTDYMPATPGVGPRRFSHVHAPRRVVRLVEGLAGEVQFKVDFCPRPSYGRVVPSFRTAIDGVSVVGPAAWPLRLRASIALRIDDQSARGDFSVRAGERVALVLELNDPPTPCDSDVLTSALADFAMTSDFWQAWVGQCGYQGRYAGEVVRSAITLKLLTYAPTGAFVAAPTTSLPEEIGGVRNWDYRYTWIRDAAFAAYGLYLAGHPEDCDQLLEWFCHVAMQSHSKLQIVYGLHGERKLTERVLDHLAGYCGSRPVRVGNAAWRQFQLDVYGELLDCFHTGRRFGQLTTEEIHQYWHCFRGLVDFVVANWQRPDSGIWEVRSRPENFVYSKVMAWVALDRGIKAAEELGLPTDLTAWRRTRAAIRAQVLERGYDPQLGVFTRAYGDRTLDAANLLLPLVHFIDARDPRMISTIEAIQRDLSVDGLVYRYRDAADGVFGDEATFGVCTFWLIDNLTALGRLDEATDLFDRMLARATPLGLYAEEIEVRAGAQRGNFPQALTHIGLINAAVNLDRAISGGKVPPAPATTADVTPAVAEPA